MSLASPDPAELPPTFPAARRATWATAMALATALAVLPALALTVLRSAPDPTSAATGVGAPPRAYLPLAWQGTTPYSRTYRHPELAAKGWQARDAFLAAHPITAALAIHPEQPPSLAAAQAQVKAACHDFPDLPETFGPGAHRHACNEWVAGYLGVVRSAELWRAHRAGARGGTPGRVTSPGGVLQAGSVADAGWAGAYLDVQAEALAAFVYGAEDAPDGISYRDSKAAVWQNPLRIVNLAVSAELLRQSGALDAGRQARVEELLSAVARQWYAAWWSTGIHPSHGVTLTTRHAAEAPARSLAGRAVAPTAAFSFTWDADHGNTPAEETAWMGAGVMLATRILGDRLPEGAELHAAGRHYVDFSIAFDRLDPERGGTVRTLNAETGGGPYGQRAMWLENHAPDTPSVPYLGSTWHFIGMALLASDQEGSVVWPTFSPDVYEWERQKDAVGNTLRAPDDRLLVSLDPRGEIDYALAAHPLWVAPCAEPRPGRQYVHYDGRAGPGPRYLSEVGVPVGIDLVTAGWPLMKISADRADTWYRDGWLQRLDAIVSSYAQHPPNPAWIACANAPWVGRNPAFQWTRLAVALSLAAVQYDGFVVEPWHPAAPTSAPTHHSPAARNALPARTAGSQP